MLDGLFLIAKADGAVHEAEMAYLEQVATIFGFPKSEFERIAARHVVPEEGDPYLILGADRRWSFEEMRRSLSPARRREPSRQGTARGLPEEFVAVANDRLAAINRAWSASRWSAAGWRGLRQRRGGAMTQSLLRALFPRPTTGRARPISPSISCFCTIPA